MDPVPHDFFGLREYLLAAETDPTRTSDARTILMRARVALESSVSAASDPRPIVAAVKRARQVALEQEALR